MLHVATHNTSLDPDQFKAQSRAIIVELLSRTTVARIKAELEKVPEEQRMAVLDAAIAHEDRSRPG